MTRLLVRHALLLGLAFVVSWWVVFNDPPELITRQPQVPGEILVALEALASDAAGPAPTVAQEGAAPDSTALEAPDPEAEAEEQPTSGPPPPELGSPLAEEEDKPQAADPSAQSTETEVAEGSTAAESASASEAPALMADPNLLAAAALEIEGRGRKGFATELIASPEDQLEIARTFGEELVLVPFRSVAPEATDPFWFRISGEETPRVERVNGAPPLSEYRQYRDLFDYEYSQLPTPLRDLRRAVLSRSEVYLFAALIPPREWALVIGRRRQALEQSGRAIDEVRTFRIRYRRAASSGFDVEVIEIIFADGSRYRPTRGAGGTGTQPDPLSLETD